MPWFSNKKSENMNSPENESDSDTGADQPQETKEREETSPPPEPQQNPALPQKWCICFERPQMTTEQGIKTVLGWLQRGFSPETLVCPIGTEEKKPLKEWDSFSKECDALLAIQKEDSVVSEVKILIEALQTEVKRLTGEMEYTKTFTSNQKEQIDKLYNESREYKADITEQYKAQLALAIIEQLDTADAKISSYKEEKISQEEFIEFCCGLADEFREMMQKRLDITYFKPESGENVALKIHKTLKRQKTNDSSLNKKIAASLRYGYGYENEEGNIEKVIRPALVETYEYVAPPSEEQPEKPEDA